MFTKGKIGPHQIKTSPVTTDLSIYHGILNCPISQRFISENKYHFIPIFLQLIDFNVIQISATDDSPLDIVFSDGIYKSFIKSYDGNKTFDIVETVYVYAEIKSVKTSRTKIDIKLSNKEYYYDYEEPVNKEDGDFWYDIKNNYLKIYDSSSSSWVMPTMYDNFLLQNVDSYITVLGKITVDGSGNISLIDSYYPNKPLSETWKWAVGAKSYIFHDDFTFGDFVNVEKVDNNLQLISGNVNGYRIMDIDLTQYRGHDFSSIEFSSNQTKILRHVDDSYIDLGTSNKLQRTQNQPFSISCKLCMETYTGIEAFFCKNNGRNSPYDYIFAILDNGTTMGVYDNVTWHKVNISTQLHHEYRLTCVYDGTQVKFYIGKNLQGSKICDLSNHTSYNVKLGGSDLSKDLNGWIRENLYFDRVLTPEEINNIDDNSYPSDYVGYWPIDECQGTTIYDHSQNELHGSVYGDMVWEDENQITFETSISINNGNTFGEWQNCLPSEMIPQFFTGLKLDNIVLKIKQNLYNFKPANLTKITDFYFLLNISPQLQPIQPTNLTLKNDEIVGLPLYLSISDIDTITSPIDYESTQYQILDANTDEILYDVIDYMSYHYVSFQSIYNEILTPQVIYKWRGRHKDKQMGWSDWSIPTTFQFNEMLNHDVVVFNQVGEFIWEVPSSAVVTADILVVAGGGGGGAYVGGGGGAGGLIYKQNISLSSDQIINIKVGNGGIGGIRDNSMNQQWPENGENSHLDDFIAIGGGAGAQHNQSYSKNGGSGGGSGNVYSGGLGIEGQGHDAGQYIQFSNGNNPHSAGGGGGAGENGYTANDEWPGPNVSLKEYGANGGNGLYYGDVFGDEFGENGWFSGGGAGGIHGNGDNAGHYGPKASVGGKGGGGDGRCNGGRNFYAQNGPTVDLYNKIDGRHATGGGGGGDGDHENYLSEGGKGGSGIVLIKYYYKTPIVNENYVVDNYLISINTYLYPYRHQPIDLNRFEITGYVADGYSYLIV